MLLGVCIGPAQAALDVGDSVRDFALRTHSGDIVTLGRLRAGAKVTLLQFVSIYCDACARETPQINRLAAQHQAQGLRVVGVALANTPQEVAATAKHWGCAYPLLADPEKITYHLYGIRNVPQLLLVDADGTIRHRTNSTDGRAFEAALQRLLDTGRDGLSNGDPAPAFTLTATDGRPVRVDFGRRRENTMISFFDRNDAANRAQAAALAQEYRAWQHASLRVYGIVSAQLADSLDSFANDTGIAFPLLLDPDGAVNRQYAARPPEIVVVNDTGRIRTRIHAKSREQLLALFARAEPPPPGTTRSETEIALLRQTYPGIISVRPVTVGKETIYLSIDPQGRKRATRFVYKDILCEVCANVSYLYTMDSKGVYRDIKLITPFELYGAPLDAQPFLNQFIGKGYADTLVPGQNVDMITGATKTCLKFIEGLNETGRVIAGFFNDPAFDTRFKRSICFLQAAEIEYALETCARQESVAPESLSVAQAAAYCPQKIVPTCPDGGQYRITVLNGIPRVRCTVHGLDPQSSLLH